MADKKVTRQLSIYINDKEVVNSLSGVEKEIRKVTNQMRNLNASSEDYEEKMRAGQQHLKVLKERQAEFKEEIYGTTQAMKQNNAELSSAGTAFSNIFNGIRNADFDMVREGFAGLKESIASTTRAALAFIATPIGATIAVLVSFYAAGKAVASFNIQLVEMNRQLRALGVNKKELADVRAEVSATATTYKKEFGEIARSANSLSKSFGLSMTEANDEIARGLANGGQMNEEFLDSIGEYDIFFSNAGYSAREFINIINTGFDLGIYTDKLPDALKEADLSLKEQTASTRDALVNAFGAAFTDEILKKIRTGEYTTKQALDEIAKRSTEVALTQQQNAQLTADVFRGAGEDAGGAFKVFEAVAKSATRELTASQQPTENLRKEMVELNKASANLFEVKGYEEFVTKGESVLVRVNTLLVKQLQFIKDAFMFIPRQLSRAFSGIYNGGVSAVERLVKISAPLLRKLGINIDSLVKKIEGLKRVEVNATVEADVDAAGAVKTVEDTTAKIKEKIQEQIDAYTKRKEYLEAAGKDTFAVEEKLLQLQMQLNKNQAEEYRKFNNDLIKLRRERRENEQEEAEKEKKLAEQRAIDMAKALKDRAKAELEYFIASRVSAIKEGQALTQESVAEETKRLEAIKAERLKALAVEHETNDGIIAAKQALGAQLTTEEIKYLTERQNLEVQFAKDTDALLRQYEEEQKALKAEQLAIQNELELAEAETRAEEERIKAEQEYKDELGRYKKMLDDKKIAFDEFTRFKEALDKKQKEMERQRELQQTASTLSALSGLAGAVGEMFGQGKEMALAQAIINGGLAVTSILAQYPKFDGGFAMWAAIATATLTTATQMRKISSAKPPKAPKFFYGGHTGDKVLYPDEYGGVTGVVHKNEYVVPAYMTQEPRYASVIGWLENERVRRNGYADGGLVTAGGAGTPAPVVAPASASDANERLTDAVNALTALLQGGIYAKTIIGYREAEDIQTLNGERLQSNANGTLNS